MVVCSTARVTTTETRDAVASLFSSSPPKRTCTARRAVTSRSRSSTERRRCSPTRERDRADDATDSGPGVTGSEEERQRAGGLDDKAGEEREGGGVQNRDVKH